MMSQGGDKILSWLPSREAVSRKLNRSSAQRWPVPRVRSTQWAVSVSISMVSGVNVAGNISVLIISFLSLSRVHFAKADRVRDQDFHEADGETIVGAVKVAVVVFAQCDTKDVVARAGGGSKACAKDAGRFAESGKGHARGDRDQA